MALSTNLVSGLSSGFDWRTMIDKLIQVEHRPVDLVENQKTAYESKLSEWQSVNTKLLALKTSAEGLADPEDFYLYTSSMSTDSSTVDGEDRFSVSTSTSGAPGTYEVVVTNLAKSQKLSSNPFTSQTSELGSSYAGDIIINGKVLTINSTDSLGDVASSINSLNTGTDPSGVTASIVKYGNNDYRLILTSDDTGADGISLLNGVSTDLIQKFGWKDKQAAVVKNSITEGAQSDRFTAHNVAIESLLGLTSEDRSSTGTLKIDDVAVTINLTTMSLTDIKDAINQAMADEEPARTDIVASIISETIDGTTYYRLQIEGTQTFVDEKNILNTVGILHNNSADIATTDTQVSSNGFTSDGAYITPDTLIVDIDGYLSWTSGDEIVMGGTDTGGGAVSNNFSITASTTVADLLSEIESQYAGAAGDVIAYVTSDGKIRVEDVAASTHLSVSLTASLDDDPDSKLDFGGFVDASSARKREIVGGEDATVLIDGVSVTNSSNTIDDVITGVTLNLVGEDSGTTVTVTLKIERDIDTTKKNIQDFVNKYNDVMSYINAQFSYDEDSETTGGVLFGDSTLGSVKSSLTSTLTESVLGVDSDFNALGLIGINTELNDDKQLKLSINDTILTGYLQTNFNEVMSLFAAQGVPSNSTLEYVGHSRDSEANTYTIHVNRAATRGTETGNVDLVSSGIADAETLTITQGSSVATITIASGTELDDIKNDINQELDREYAETLVGDQQLKEDDDATYITSETTWDNIYNTSLENNDVLEFSGTSRSGSAISGDYTISNVSSYTVQGLLSAIEDAFSSEVTATIDTSGRIVLTDKYLGNSQLSLEIDEPAGKGLDFGTVDVTSGAGDGSQEGRYAMRITADDDGSNHLVLRSDDYGSTSFTIDQDTTNGNYNHIIYTTTSNTTDSTAGTVYVTSATTWDAIYGTGTIETGDTITIAGTDRGGAALDPSGVSLTYTIDAANDIGDLLTRIEDVFADANNPTPTTVDARLEDGKIVVEDLTSGASLMSLTLTYADAGGAGSGNLDLGTFDQATERDLDLGLINGTVEGQDIAGTIGGEAATGSGQVLTGDDGNTSTDGLSIIYKGTSDDTDVGTVTLTLGVAELFERALFSIIDPVDGYGSFKVDSLQDRINGFKDDIEEMEARLDRKMEAMINRFVAMELALAKIQNQSDWLAGQLNAAFKGWR